MTLKYIKIFYICYIVSFVFILVLRKIFGSNNFWNKIVNLYIYIFEFVTFGILFNCFIDKKDFMQEKSILLIVKDFVFSNSIYQICLNMILKFWDGATIDAYNSIVVYIKLCLTNLSNKEILSTMSKKHEEEFSRQKRNGTYDKFSVEMLTRLKKYNKSYLSNQMEVGEYKINLENELIHVQNCIAITGFGWQSSLLLRFIK